MQHDADFFAGFPPVHKQEWLERISKDLKGKPLDDLYWHLGNGITVDPFAHADEFPVPSKPLRETAGGWEINEDVEEPDPVLANRQALEALGCGAESLYFNLPVQAGATLFAPLLDGIYLDHISLSFGGTGLAAAPAAVLATLGNEAKQQGRSTRDLRGSLYYDPEAGPGQVRDWRYLAELLQYAQADFPGYRCVTVDGRPEYAGVQGVAGELVGLLDRGRVYLGKLTERGVDAGEVARQLQFSLYIGKSYFVEIAKLRAFSLLWMNVLKVWGAEPVLPVLDVRFFPGDYSDALYSNMIRATTMAMSAVLGGAQRLTVLPYDTGREAQATYPPAFARRIARNVQHLLKLESEFGDMTDPVAGSYYIEKLTAQLAQTAWDKFRQC